jgi:ribosomal protein L7/L12
MADGELKRYAKESEEAVARGLAPSDVVRLLHERGLTIIESIKVTMRVYGLSLGEAKKLVTNHAVWAAHVRAADELHDELEIELRRMNEGEELKR